VVIRSGEEHEANGAPVFVPPRVCSTNICLCICICANCAADEGVEREKKKLQKAVEAKALELLDSTLVDAQMLKLVENQTLFKSVAADLVQTNWRPK
jgi:hypothetical protein